MGVTEYFRKALAVQMSPRVDFKNGDFIKIAREHVEQGKITCVDASRLFQNKKEKNKYEITELPVLIALKVIKPVIVDSRKNTTSMEELTAVYYLPALLFRDGSLGPSPDKNPWFAREFLTPMIDPEISVGANDDVDRFLRDNAAERIQIDSWEKYWIYTRRMYETVTHTDLYSKSIGTLENIETEDFCYIFCDEIIKSTVHILKLYDSILGLKGKVKLPLYDQFVALDPKSTRDLVGDSLATMQRHCGQMGGEYPLSVSQREALNHLDVLKNGEILAVSGPPGTGKTTLLQSVVANLVTSHAIDRKDPPIIVATSTNNQAVTNIIDSFGSVKALGIRNLEFRWVSAVESFAVYYPSGSREKEAKQKGYQLGNDLLTKINDREIIAQSQGKFLKHCSEYFTQPMQSIEQCRDKLHQELTYLDRIRRQLLEEFESLLRRMKGKTIAEYIGNLQSLRGDIMGEINQIEFCCQTLQGQCDGYANRVQEWSGAYKKLPWYIRVFSFVPIFNKQITHWTKTYKTPAELVDLESAITPQMVLQRYKQLITEAESRVSDLKKETEKLRRRLGEYNAIIQQIQVILENYEIKAKEFENHSVDLIGTHKRKANRDGKDAPSIRKILMNCNQNSFNELIDTSFRYVEFWLAVHYYECGWLLSEPLTEKQLGKNFENVVKKGLKSLSMLTPCMVMTFFMLPKQFELYMAQERYLYNYIDLLIVDEAGQTSPEVAAPAFALAKRALVVGDEQQIAPVWGVKRPLDIAMAIECGVIDCEDSFERLVQNGINTSESSVMRVASQSCPYKKYDKGLFLCEHRRCYDEIINYCNDLVYKRRLQPCRGKATEDRTRPEVMAQFPVMGYFDIPTDRSKKVGSSRENQAEAKRIATWLQSHYREICDGYASLEKSVPEKDVFAIITPFTGQVKAIMRELSAIMGDQSKNITVGTVHTFQGGERRIIIFSTVYGALDGCYFIDKESNLMNVAVSRAKDAFWVFGSSKCLEGKTKQLASGLLREYTKDHKIMS